MIELAPLGDRAFLARFATEDEARRWAEAARRSRLPGVVDVVLAYRDVAIFPDPSFDAFDDLEASLRTLQPIDGANAPGILHRIPTLYDGEDLAEVARRIGTTSAEVIALHANREYAVMAIGFLPGFAYAGDLPAGLAGLPRRDRPRTRVARGSVAIAGRQTGIYPDDSPGGWHLLGRTPLKIVDLDAGHFPIQAGDRLVFIPIDLPEYQARRDEWL